MRRWSFILAILSCNIIWISCSADPTSPGGKLGTKNYYGNYTMGVTSGTANVYLNATSDTLIDLRYSLAGGPSTTLHNISFKDDTTSYHLALTDAIGTLTGTTTTNFSTLTFQYVTAGNTLGFTGAKIQ